ncbi:MAG: FHA domain-containing protein [Acidobacteriota bacterium]
MNHAFVGFALLQAESDNSSMWIILAVVLVILFFIVVVVGVGLTIFFVMRKRSKAQNVPAASAAAVLNDAGSSTGFAQQTPNVAPAFEPPPAPFDSPATEEVTRWPGAPDVPLAPPVEPEAKEFDPSATVAIVREPVVEINYGTIKFVSGVLAGEEFVVDPEGSYIGREPSLSQIIISDPRISKRHLWVGVRDGVVTIVDQESRNGTFLNDPRSERVHEAKLDSGDTVIMGESDVARFEYHS